MRYYNVKKFFVLCLMTTTICLLISGCGGKKSNSDSVDADNNISSEFSKDDFIGLLGAEFGYEDYVNESAIFDDVKESNNYYSQIQACSEWGIIEDAGKFEPENSVTLGYAIESSVNMQYLYDTIHQDDGAPVLRWCRRSAPSKT